MTCTWRSEGRVCSPLPPCGAEDQTQIVRPGSKCLSLPSHQFLYRYCDPKSSLHACMTCTLSTKPSSFSAGIFVILGHGTLNMPFPLPPPQFPFSYSPQAAISKWDSPYQSVGRIGHLCEGGVGVAQVLQFAGCPRGSASRGLSLSLGRNLQKEVHMFSSTLCVACWAWTPLGQPELSWSSRCPAHSCPIRDQFQ